MRPEPAVKCRRCSVTVPERLVAMPGRCSDRRCPLNDPAENEKRTLLYTVRACRGQYARPPHITREEELAAVTRGLLRFEEWPSGHYVVTSTGERLLSEGASL